MRRGFLVPGLFAAGPAIRAAPDRDIELLIRVGQGITNHCIGIYDVRYVDLEDFWKWL